MGEILGDAQVVVGAERDALRAVHRRGNCLQRGRDDVGVDADAPEDLAADLYGIFYTGGTTAASKGVMLSHGNILANAMNMMVEAPFDTGTVYLHVAPMFHLADCSATFTLTDAGGTHTFVPRFDAVAVMRLIQDRRVTNSILVPAMIGMLVNHPAIGDYDHVRDQVMVSSTLDALAVPAFVVDYLMFHELLHKRHGVRYVNNRGMAHTREFYADERRFERYAEADEWLKRLARGNRKTAG